MIPDDGCQEIEVFHIVSLKGIPAQTVLTGNTKRAYNFTFHNKAFDNLIWKSQTDIDTPIRVITVAGASLTGKATLLKY